MLKEKFTILTRRYLFACVAGSLAFMTSGGASRAEETNQPERERIVTQGMVKSPGDDFLYYQSYSDKVVMKFWPRSGPVKSMTLTDQGAIIQDIQLQSATDGWIISRLGRLADQATRFNPTTGEISGVWKSSHFKPSPTGEFLAMAPAELKIATSTRERWSNDWIAIDEVYVHPRVGPAIRDKDGFVEAAGLDATDDMRIGVDGWRWTGPRRLEFIYSSEPYTAEGDAPQEFHHVVVDVKKGQKAPVTSAKQLKIKSKRLKKEEHTAIHEAFTAGNTADKKGHTVMTLGSDSPIRAFEFIDALPPYAYSHTSTIAEIAPGEFLAAWVGGPEPRVPEDNIWIARRVNGIWETPVEAVKSEAPCFNPIIIPQKQSGELILSYKIGPAPTSWTGVLRRSRDGGRTWSDPEILPAGLVGPVRSKPLILEDGTMICGDSVEAFEAWAGWVNITHDAGRTWTRHGPITIPGQPHGVIQPVIFWADAEKKTLRALLRGSDKIKALCESTSSDLGKTWTPARPVPELPNPNSAIDIIELPDGRLVMAHNDQATGKNRLSLSVSADHGVTWKHAAVLYEESEGEYSYPAMILGSDGLIRVTFSWKKQKIGYVEVDPGKL